MPSRSLEQLPRDLTAGLAPLYVIHGEEMLLALEAAGLKVSGRSSGHEQLVETIELPDHPWFFACQFHPEFTSTPRDGHPLFKAYIEAALAYQATRRQAD